MKTEEQKTGEPWERGYELPTRADGTEVLEMAVDTVQFSGWISGR